MDTHSGATTQRRAGSAPGRYTLSQWDKGRFHRGMGRNSKRQPHREKMRNDVRCHGRSFWTVWVTCRAPQRRWRTETPFFFSCIINVISDGNTALTHAAGTGEFVCPIRKNVLPFTRQERRYCVAEKLHRHMHASLILFFFSSGILRKGCME